MDASMIKEFTVGVGHTVNLGNYESLKVDASVTVNIEDVDDWETLRQSAQEALSTLLADSVKAQLAPGWFEQIPGKRKRV
jgi:hypothetical protein